MGALNFTAKQVEVYIKLLITAKKIVEYKVTGVKIHWLVNFLKHQKVVNASTPSLPLPNWIKFEIKHYPSGKAYAVYKIDESSLQETPGNFQEFQRNCPEFPRVLY